MPPLPNSRVSIVELRGLVDDGCELDKYVNNRFDELDADNSGMLSKEELRPALLQMTELLGLARPDNREAEDVLLDEVFHSFFPENLGAGVDRDTFISVSKEVLCQIGEGSGLALVKSMSDGAAVRELLAEEGDIMATVNDIFTELDRENSGKLDGSHVKTVLEALGLDSRLGSEEDDSKFSSVVDELIPKYANGKEYLEKEDILHLLQDVLGGAS